jgi:hypothetical protein
MNAIVNARRRRVINSYEDAKADNEIRFLEGDKKATSEYIYQNQKDDAAGIVNEYYNNNRRVVSIMKKTKVGADGLMIELAKQMTTHTDDNFVVNFENVRILTGMSNASWEKDMKEKAPNCFKDKIFHHGQLKHSELRDLENALIIIDELDTGDKNAQVLHLELQAAGVLDVKYMEEKNIRFLFISATMVKELYNLYQWGDLHCLYRMTIPAAYIGHKEFLERGLIQEWYALNTEIAATTWVQSDILGYYGADYRIHLVRANLKTLPFIQSACSSNGVECRNHTSSDRIEEDIFRDLFEKPLQRHVVLVVKGFFRRANLIPNEWKLRIGATHEIYKSKTQVDYNVEIQAFPGRMSGYWRDIIENGHKTGPHRTSIEAVRQYELVYENPFGNNSYQTAGFKKKNGRVTLSTPVFVTPSNISGLQAGPAPTGSEVQIDNKKTVPIVLPMENTEINRIHALTTSQKRKALIAILKAHIVANPTPRLPATMAACLDGFEVGQITRPDTENSRKKSIDDPVRAAQENRPYSVNVKEAHKDKDSWQATFDDRENRVIFMIYCAPLSAP